MIPVTPRILKDDPTAQEFVNELNIAEDYKEPAKRKYNERSFYFNAFCRLFFYAGTGSHISVLDSGNGEKNGNDNGPEN